MNIASAIAIPMRDILSSIGVQPVKEQGSSLYYLSPWRNERTASFHVSIPKNVWYDHGEGIGGDSVSFACTYLEKTGQSCSVSDGLAWLGRAIGAVPDYVPVQRILRPDEPSILRLKKSGPIKHIALIRYLEQRSIPLGVARDVLEEAWIENTETGKSFFSLALRNEDDGFELRNPFFKGSLRPKTITFIRGSDPGSQTINAFEGSMDYLSIIARQDGKRFSGDTIILNSLSCLSHAFPYIRNYGYRIAYSWFDNDAAGHKATQLYADFLRTEQDLQHQAMNPIYAAYKDVNEWHVATPRLG